MRYLAMIGLTVLLASCGDPAGGDEHVEHGDGRGAEQGGTHEGETHEGEAEGAHEDKEVELTDIQRTNAGVQTEVLLARPLAATVQASAEVAFDPDRMALVASPVQGRVAEVRVVPGTPVERGTLLAIIDSRELAEAKGAYLVATAAFALADQNLERERGLAAQKISSALDLSTAEAERLQAQASLEAAEETLLAFGMSETAIEELRPDRHAPSRLQLKSPIAGVITRRDAVVGAGIEPLEALFTVADTTRVWVRVNLLERDVASVRVGQGASVRTSAFDEVFRGDVTYVAPVMDEDTRTVAARIEVDNPAGALRPGMFAQVEIEIGGEQGPVLAIPSEAILRRGGEFFAFIEEAPGRFRRVELQLGPTVGSQQVVKTGLEAGQTVVVAGAFFLQSEVEKGGFEAGHAH